MQRHQIGRQGLFRPECGHAHTRIDAHCTAFDHGNREEHPRARNAIQAAESQNNDLFPLLRDMHGYSDRASENECCDEGRKPYAV